MSYLSSPSVKRVTITSDFDMDQDRLNFIRLETPSLLYLDYSSDIAKRYYVSLDSLAEARLDLRLHVPYYREGEIYGNITSLMEGMRNIKSLHLTPHSLEVFYFCCPSMPVLNNLLRLSIELKKQENWHTVPRLLHNSPNLQTLVIKGLVHVWFPTKSKEMVCCLSKCRVKVLEISGYTGSLGELKQMRFFFGIMECLETVKVRFEEDSNNYYLRTNLMALPRVSSKCKIQVLP